METYKQIDLNDYVQTGEGGTSLTYTHKTRHTMAKLFNLVNEAELAEKEFLTARAVFEMGIPTPEPLQLVTDGERRGVEYELISNKRSFTRIISQEPERLEEISLAFASMARELHETKADTTRFPSVKETLRRFYQEKGDRVTEEYKERALAFIDKTPDADTCLHGDLHHNRCRHDTISVIIAINKDFIFIINSGFHYCDCFIDIFKRMPFGKRRNTYWRGQSFVFLFVNMEIV